MMGSLKIAAAAALVAALPLAANAVTISGNINDTDTTVGSGPDPDGTTYPISGVPYSATIQFVEGDDAGELAFQFNNDTGATAVISLVASVNQLAGFFTDGITSLWPSSPPAGFNYTPEGVSETFFLTATLDPGVSDITLFTYGDPVTNGNQNDPNAVGPTLSVQIVSGIPTIPLPASILMLLGALGGLGYVGYAGRRRTA